ncbi:hypothetical protein [Dyadobacter alkalitolerans]|uniref:hypothetical protein n=1 Tax=Dyadobacter alkalitolerans TaxID=492736 RepID=UPI00047B1781|nr:hypothetical protein [Dyadobacter alkalitolerans]
MGLSFFLYLSIPGLKPGAILLISPMGFFIYNWQPEPIGLNHILAPAFNLGIIGARISFAPDGAFLFHLSFWPRVETRGNFIDQPDGLFYFQLATKAHRAESYIGPSFQPGDHRGRIFFAPDRAFLFPLTFGPGLKPGAILLVSPMGFLTYNWQPKPIGLNHILAPGFNLGIIGARKFFASVGAFLFLYLGARMFFIQL